MSSGAAPTRSGDLEIARRRILLDQTVLLGNNLSVFL